VNSNKTGTITRPPSLKPNWRPPLEVRRRKYTSSKNSDFCLSSYART
jgi:hypothetical protein